MPKPAPTANLRQARGPSAPPHPSVAVGPWAAAGDVVAAGLVPVTPPIKPAAARNGRNQANGAGSGHGVDDATDGDRHGNGDSREGKGGGKQLLGLLQEASPALPQPLYPLMPPPHRQAPSAATGASMEEAGGSAATATTGKGDRGSSSAPQDNQGGPEGGMHTGKEVPTEPGFEFESVPGSEPSSVYNTASSNIVEEVGEVEVARVARAVHAAHAVHTHHQRSPKRSKARARARARAKEGSREKKGVSWRQGDDLLQGLDGEAGGSGGSEQRGEAVGGGSGGSSQEGSHQGPHQPRPRQRQRQEAASKSGQKSVVGGGKQDGTNVLAAGRAGEDREDIEECVTESGSVCTALSQFSGVGNGCAKWGDQGVAGSQMGGGRGDGEEEEGSYTATYL